MDIGKGNARMKTVFEIVVKSKGIWRDKLQWARNIFGMNLIGYEEMIRQGLDEALDKLYTKYPKVQNVRVSTMNVAQGAAEIVVYGEIDE